jgi:cell division protein FtsB
VSAATRSPSSVIRWDRISRYGLLAVLVGLMFLYVNPARSYLNTMREASHRHAEVSGLKRENQRLQAKRRALGDPRTLEAEARRLGMVRSGERPYVVRGLPHGR